MDMGLSETNRNLVEGSCAEVFDRWRHADRDGTDAALADLTARLARMEERTAESARMLVRRMILTWPEDLAMLCGEAIEPAKALRAIPRELPRKVTVRGELLDGPDKPQRQSGGLARHTASALLAEEGEGSGLVYLPLLGQPGYFVKGWSHILAGYPKVGKTELMFQAVQAWTGERVLYLTEEDRTLWRQRLLARGGDAPAHVAFVFAMGATPQMVVDTIVNGDETVVVVDTIRTVLRMRDETDNSEIARVLQPVIVACRERGRTLVLLHHVRKGGGEGTEGITGGHAFVGTVDVALSVVFGGGALRRIFGQGRLQMVPELWYERAEDGQFTVRGTPERMAVSGEDEDRALGVLTREWQTTTQVQTALGANAPSRPHLLATLQSLVAQGLAERLPAEVRPGVTYQFRRVADHS